MVFRQRAQTVAAMRKLLSPRGDYAPVLKLAKLAFAAIIVSLTLLSSGALASAAPTGVTGTPAGYGNGYNDVIGTVPVYNHLMTIGSSKVYVYCLIQAEGYQSSGVYNASSAASVTNLDAALNIAANSSTIGTPLADANSEAVAIQIAIWHETGAFNISQVNNSTIDARAEALVAAAGSLAPSTQVGVYTLRATETRILGGAVVHFHLVGANARAADITVSAGGAPRTYKVSAAGTLSLNVRGRRVVRATYTEIIPAGTIMAPTVSADQPLVTAEAVSVTTSASVLTRPLVKHVAPTTITTTHVGPTTTTHHVTTTTHHVTTTTRRPVTTTTHRVIPVTTTTQAKSPAVCTTLGLTWKSWQVLFAGLILFLLGLAIGSMLRRRDRDYE
jgi:hypothetical protein